MEYKIKDIKSSLREYVETQKNEFNQKQGMIDDISLDEKKVSLSNVPSVNLYSGKDEHINAIVSLRNSAKKELLQIAPRFQGGYSSMNSVKKTLMRGVKMKLIVSSISDDNKKQILNCYENGGEVRLLNSTNLSFVVKDNFSNSEERMVLSSENVSLLEMLVHTFKRLWKKATPIGLKDLE